MSKHTGYFSNNVVLSPGCNDKSYNSYHIVIKINAPKNT